VIQSPDAPKTRRLIWALIFVIVGACLGCAALATLGPRRTAPTPPPTVAPTVAPTALPTATLQPAPVPLPNQATPARPRGQAEADYIADLLDISADYTVAFASLNDLTQAAADDPELAASTGWQNQIVSVASDIRACNQRVQRMTPPPRLIAAHFALVGAADAYDLAMTDLVAGVLSQDASLIDRAAGNIALGNANLAEATRQLEMLSADLPPAQEDSDA